MVAARIGSGGRGLGIRNSFRGWGDGYMEGSRGWVYRWMRRRWDKRIDPISDAGGCVMAGIEIETCGFGVLVTNSFSRFDCALLMVVSREGG